MNELHLASEGQSRGGTWRQWRVVVQEPIETLADIAEVEYELPVGFPDPIRVVHDSSSNFQLMVSAPSGTQIVATARLRDGAESRITHTLGTSPTGVSALVGHQVVWERVSPAVFETMICVLLRRLNPEGMRIDGSGGDRGIDFGVRVGDQLEIFELKSFTGRLTPGRRRQVSRSLQSAAQHSPTRWSLVVPIDLTPEEDEWFRAFAETSQFAVTWLGKTWLDSQMAAYPDIPRYFLDNGSDAVVDMLRELRAEQADLAGGVPDAVNRVQGLVSRLNEIDPYFTFAVASDGRESRVEVFSRYPEALNDRPVTIHLSAQFPNTELGREALESLRESMEYGKPTTLGGEFLRSVTIDAPGGLAGRFEGGQISFSPVLPAGTPPADAVLTAISSDGTILNSMPIRFDLASGGLKGVVLRGRDRLGVLNCDLTIDVHGARGRMNISFNVAEEALPSELLPAFQLLANLAKPNRMRISGAAFGEAETADLPDLPLVDANAIRFIEALGRVQVKTGSYFPMPFSPTAEDFRTLEICDRLLAGEIVTQDWEELRMEVTVTDKAAINELLTDAEPRSLRFATSRTETIASNPVPLGPIEIELASAVVANREELLNSGITEGTELALQLEPANDRSMRMALAATGLS